MMITNPSRRSALSMLAGMIALFVVAVSGTARAQHPPPCDGIWVDDNIPVTATLNWLPAATPTSVVAPPPNNFYTVTPPSNLQSFSITLPCGAVLGPFLPNSSQCLVDPCTGHCIYIDETLIGPPIGTCPFEIHVYEDACTGCK